MQTCRGSHTHTLLKSPSDDANLYVYVSGTGGVRSTLEMASCVNAGASDPNSSFYRIEVIKVPLAAPQTAAVVNESRLFTDPVTGAMNGLQNAPPTPQHPSGMNWGPTPITDCMPRHHDLSGDRAGRRGLRGQRPADRHQRSRQSEADRRRRRPELRVLARGDVLERRHDGRVHGRVGRRDFRALPRDRPAQLGCECDLRHRRQEARVPQLLQDARGADAPGELCRPSAVDRPGSRPRHPGPGLVPGRRVDLRLHGFGAPEGDRLLRPRPDRRNRARARRSLVDLLLQRRCLRLRDRARLRLRGSSCRTPSSRRTRSRRPRK